MSSGAPKKWYALALSKGVAMRSRGVARMGGVVYEKVFGPNVLSSYVKRPRDEGLVVSFFSTRVVPQLRTSSSTEGGKSEPARIRQPTVDGSLAKSRRPRVTKVDDPPMTLVRGGLLGIRISSMMSIPSDTHDICGVELVDMVNRTLFGCVVMEE